MRGCLLLFACLILLGVVLAITAVALPAVAAQGLAIGLRSSWLLIVGAILAVALLGLAFLSRGGGERRECAHRARLEQRREIETMREGVRRMRERLDNLEVLLRDR